MRDWSEDPFLWGVFGCLGYSSISIRIVGITILVTIFTLFDSSSQHVLIFYYFFIISFNFQHNLKAVLTLHYDTNSKTHRHMHTYTNCSNNLQQNILSLQHKCLYKTTIRCIVSQHLPFLSVCLSFHVTLLSDVLF